MMKLLPRRACACALLAVIGAMTTIVSAGVIAPFAVPYLPVPKGAAVILNTGSTNTAGYRIVVRPTGESEYAMRSGSLSGRGRQIGAVSQAQAQRFFRDLAAAAPLQNLRSVPCMKSASFGSSLFVWWNHERSPDLSCARGTAALALAGDAAEIATALNVAAFGKPLVRPMMPGESHREAPQSSSAPVSPSPLPSRP
ncbi:MAG: hypothetical protein DLM53_02570 [Candidatus Eremiobacter antarcticus]|nr:hypothetical protein [Candidatus Eremiobacteraeota bacterium]MBC5808294.1 hypothetical protein [Candidatus Eremiobacteraeota bacterium]PZR63668.1 MAG: hypothetical protein DLM53_02570 [Candidatus Eremiobacter sp. RRmetagenome_bin22]